MKGKHMLKGLALTPPIIGRISIGKVVEKNGKRLPEKDDEFTITSQVQNRDGWIAHPLDEALRKSAGGKLRSIPVRLLFDDPDLNLRANFCMFDRTSGRPLCVGDGATCKRSTASGIQSMACPSPDACDLAEAGGCKPYGRMNVRIGDDDELGGFVFRTTGFNSIRTLATRLKYFHAVCGGHLSCLPLELRLRGKSTTRSHRTAVFYVDLVGRTGMTLAEILYAGKKLQDERQAAGFDQAALENAAREGLERGAFEESGEEGAVVVDEFYPPDRADRAAEGPQPKASLAGKLASKAKDASSRSKTTDAVIQPSQEEPR
jgi:hypothetical protein